MYGFADLFSGAFDNMRDVAIHLTSYGGRPNLTSASRLYAVFAGCTAFTAVGLPSLILHLFRNRRSKESSRHGPRGLRI